MKKLVLSSLLLIPAYSLKAMSAFNTFKKPVTITAGLAAGIYSTYLGSCFFNHHFKRGHEEYAKAQKCIKDGALLYHPDFDRIENSKYKKNHCAALTKGQNDAFGQQQKKHTEHMAQAKKHHTYAFLTLATPLSLAIIKSISYLLRIK